jgi:hypothetical protein
MVLNCQSEQEAENNICGGFLQIAYAITRKGDPDYKGDLFQCEASRCLMWRWIDLVEAKGYCGLAGKPY